MQTKRFGLLMALIILVPLILASQPKIETKCKSDSFTIAHFEQAGKGWDIDFIDRTKILSTGHYVDAGRETPYLCTVYAVRKKVLELPWIVVDPCDYSATLSYIYVLPVDVRQISKGNRVFAYRVWGDLVRGPRLDSGGVGGSGIFMFYDMHGTGKFDGLEVLVPSTPLVVPEWVKQLPPSP